MLFGLFIGLFTSVLRVCSLKEFLLDNNDILGILCSDSTSWKSVSSPLKTELCDQEMANNKGLSCTILQTQNKQYYYVLSVYFKQYNTEEHYSCRIIQFLDSLSEQGIPTLFTLYDANKLHILIYSSQDFIEQSNIPRSVLNSRKLADTCSAALKFSIVRFTQVGTYNYKTHLAILNSCDTLVDNCGLTVSNYATYSVPFSLTDSDTSIKASFSAVDISAKTYAIIIEAPGTKHVTYQNEFLIEPPDKVSYEDINLVYMETGGSYFPFSWVISGIIKSPVNTQIQIAISADDRSEMFLFGETTAAISSVWPNKVYSLPYSISLGQDIPFIIKNYNNNWQATANIFYKGPDSIEKKFILIDTYYLGMTSYSPWYIEDYVPILNIPSYESLSFSEVTYTDCDRIYVDMQNKNKFWPMLCSSHYVSRDVKKCLGCVNGAYMMGYSCVCNEGYYEDPQSNSCIQSAPITVLLHKIEPYSGKVMILVISNSCTIDSASYCKESAGIRYLTKPRHTEFTSSKVYMKAQDYINPDGAYTIYINTLQPGGLTIKCFSNTSFSGVPFYERTDSILLHNFSDSNFYDKTTSCVVYGYIRVLVSIYVTVYIQGSDIVTSYINNSRITTYDASEAEMQYTEYYNTFYYIPIKVEFINTSAESKINFEYEYQISPYERVYLEPARLYSPSRVLGKVWDINTSQKYLTIEENLIENNVRFCDEHCKSCNINYDGSSTCIRCIENASLSSSDCICDIRYYYNSAEESCIGCTNNCLACTDAINCVKCDNGFFLDSITQTCNSCQSNCKSCPYGVCAQCNTSFILKDGICICDDGYSLSNDQSKCLQLIKGCEEFEISDSIVCKQCKSGLILQNGECLCDLGYFYNSVMLRCEACPINCLKCISEECTVCNDGFMLISSDEILNRCIAYMTLCSEFYLENEEMLCKKCKDNTILEDDECVCKDGYYLDIDSYGCNNCTSICQKCKSEVDNACSICESVCSQQDFSDTQKETDIVPYEYRQAKKIAKKISIVSSSLSGVVLCIGLLTLNLDKAWTFLNLMQIYSIIPLLQVDIPIILNESLKSQDGTKLMPDLLEYYLDYEYQGPEVYAKAKDYKYKTPLLIINSGKIILTFIFLLLINFIFYAGFRVFKGKLQRICSAGYNYFRWSVYLRFYIQIYLELSIVSILNIIYVIFT